MKFSSIKTIFLMAINEFMKLENVGWFRNRVVLAYQNKIHFFQPIDTRGTSTANGAPNPLQSGASFKPTTPGTGVI